MLHHPEKRHELNFSKSCPQLSSLSYIHIMNLIKKTKNTNRLTGIAGTWPPCVDCLEHEPVIGLSSVERSLLLRFYHCSRHTLLEMVGILVADVLHKAVFRNFRQMTYKFPPTQTTKQHQHCFLKIWVSFCSATRCMAWPQLLKNLPSAVSSSVPAYWEFDKIKHNKAYKPFDWMAGIYLTPGVDCLGREPAIRFSNFFFFKFRFRIEKSLHHSFHCAVYSTNCIIAQWCK